MCRRDGTNSISWRYNLRKEKHFFRSRDEGRGSLGWILNNVELDRKELWKDHHDSKQGTRLLPEGEGWAGKGLGRRGKRFRTVAVGNVKETQHEEGQKWLNHAGAQLSFGSMNSLV